MHILTYKHASHLFTKYINSQIIAHYYYTYIRHTYTHKPIHDNYINIDLFVCILCVLLVFNLSLAKKITYKYILLKILKHLYNSQEQESRFACMCRGHLC